MRDLDLSLGPSDGLLAPSAPLLADPPSAPPTALATTAESRPMEEGITDAHELLLRNLDEVRRAAQLVAERTKALESLLAPSEVLLRQRAEAQERSVREALAAIEREWAQTAVRYRTLADELSRRNAWEEGRVVKRASLLRPLLAALLGGLLAGMIALWTAGAFAPMAAALASPSPDPIASVKPKPPASRPAR